MDEKIFVYTWSIYNIGVMETEAVYAPNIYRALEILVLNGRIDVREFVFSALQNLTPEDEFLEYEDILEFPTLKLFGAMTQIDYTNIYDPNNVEHYKEFMNADEGQRWELSEILEDDQMIFLLDNTPDLPTERVKDIKNMIESDEDPRDSLVSLLREYSDRLNLTTDFIDIIVNYIIMHELFNLLNHVKTFGRSNNSYVIEEVTPLQ